MRINFISNSIVHTPIVSLTTAHMVVNYCFTWIGIKFERWIRSIKLNPTTLALPNKMLSPIISSAFWKLHQTPKRKKINNTNGATASSTTLKYGIFQLEICPISNKLHLQGYLEHKCDKRITTLTSSRCMPGAHFEKRQGTAKQARDYCLKADTQVHGPWEFGTFKEDGRGRRNELNLLHTALIQGKDDEYLSNHHFGSFLRYQRGISAWRQCNLKHRNFLTVLEVIIGSPGVGKTRFIHELYPKAYWKDGTPWWPGYTGQPVVICDEFCGSLMITLVNRMCGAETPLQVQLKGTSTPFLAKKVIMISNVGPEHWWNWEKAKTPREAVKRRIGATLLWTTMRSLTSRSMILDQHRWMDGIDHEAWHFKEDQLPLFDTNPGLCRTDQTGLAAMNNLFDK